MTRNGYYYSNLNKNIFEVQNFKHVKYLTGNEFNHRNNDYKYI